jgi:hypothetical protein
MTNVMLAAADDTAAQFEILRIMLAETPLPVYGFVT